MFRVLPVFFLSSNNALLIIFYVYLYAFLVIDLVQIPRSITAAASDSLRNSSLESLSSSNAEDWFSCPLLSCYMIPHRLLGFLYFQEDMLLQLACVSRLVHWGFWQQVLFTTISNVSLADVFPSSTWATGDPSSTASQPRHRL